MKNIEERGSVTHRIIELTGGDGYEGAKPILHFLPYMQCVLMQNKAIDERLLMQKEIRLLEGWRDAGYVSYGGDAPCSCTKEFWDWMNEVLFAGYVLEKDTQETEKKNEISGDRLARSLNALASIFDEEDDLK